MKRNVVLQRLLRLRRDERGQTLPIVAFMLMCLLGMTGYVVDIGRGMYTYRQLQASTDAAALAGASALPSSNAASVATQYSAVAGNLNAKASLPGVTMVSGYPQVRCLGSLTSQGMACGTPANGNAVTVKQQINLPMYFMRILGKNTLTITASATSAMRGASPIPYNVAIVVDTTLSMNSLDADSSCLDTRLNCANVGVQTLLHMLSPCQNSLSTCGTVTNGNVANPVDLVSLYTFPGFTSTTQAAKDYDCSTTSAPTISKYTDPYKPVYQVVDFSSDYRTSDTNANLNTSSNLVKAVGGKLGCTGLQAVGIYGTYYAGAIYQAQSDLVDQAASHPGSQNVMIILTDGDANEYLQAYMPYGSPTSGVYASLRNECRQGVVAAQAAATAGTKVYTVAYGATSTGCVTDTSGITPCQAAQQMASSPEYFFSDYTATGGSSSCVSAAQPTTSLKQIFQQIGNNLTVGRLIPDNTT